jgi:threonyl-tRNA synthetase
MLIIGDKEAETQTVSVRLRNGEQLPAAPVSDVKARIKATIDSKGLGL